MYAGIYGPDAIASSDNLPSIAYDKAQQDGYLAAYDQTYDAADAKSVADAIGAREQLEAQIAQEQDPNVLAKLNADYTKLTYALISKDVYYQTSIPQLLPA